MQWLTLFDKLGKQPVRNLRNKDITVIVNNQSIKVTGVKFMANGTPYLITEEIKKKSGKE
ncbi:MAG: hypothetical protein K0R54_683 [Clostridiaceae bacterium]|jgi:hypothetical protein|nr:hypothetical protein [Clostridiaceae bacterium]